MIFADNIVLCSESREEVQTVLEKCRQTLESRRPKICVYGFECEVRSSKFTRSTD